jgi:predicted nucleic acid-binding protein
MANDIFIDTSGFFAVLSADDDRHRSALRIVEESRKRKRGFVTTDYVLDETATLLKARRMGHLTERFFAIVEQSRACRIEWMDSARFGETQLFFLKHSDQAWSFTDCFSYLIMKQLRLRDAFTKDDHFRQAGFNLPLR